MKFDFDKVNDRRGSNSFKWDIPEDEMAMWVADMDFQTAPAVIDALAKRVSHGIFGYNIVPDEWYDAIQGWWSRRHGYVIEKEWLTFCTGVVPAITCAVKRLTNEGDNVLVQTPVYDIFFHSVENTGRHVLENELVYDGENYHIDFEDLETKLSHPLTTMMILCNPHNPVGKIWSKDILDRIGQLCKKYNVTVLSDEIHCDITQPGHGYVPFASVSEICADISVTCISATKAFNIAGLQTAAIVISNDRLRAIMVRGLNSDEIAEPNSFAIQAVVAAFNGAEEWLDELNEYIYDNKTYVTDQIGQELPELKIVPSDATYLLWIDCSKVTDDTEELCDYLRSKHKIFLSSGAMYRGDGNRFVRMNLACPRANVQVGLRRFIQGIKTYKKGN